jgi:hypothetical protein
MSSTFTATLQLEIKIDNRREKRGNYVLKPTIVSPFLSSCCFFDKHAAFLWLPPHRTARMPGTVAGLAVDWYNVSSFEFG